MSDPTSIFTNQSNQQATPASNSDNGNAANVQNNDPYADLLGSIKNERGEPKYKTLQDAIIALKHSQDYIPQLTTQLSQKDSELATARQEAAKIAELERSIAALTTHQTSQQSNTQTPSVTEEQIAEFVNRSLTRKQAEDTQAINLSRVVSEMQTKFGTDAEKAFYTKATELGMSVEAFNKLAATTPMAVLSLMGVTVATKPAVTNQNGSSFNTEAFQPAQDSFIGRNQKPMLIGATTQDMRNEAISAKKMVDQLHAEGKTVHDLTDPKVYFKMFS